MLNNAGDVKKHLIKQRVFFIQYTIEGYIQICYNETLIVLQIVSDSFVVANNLQLFVF